MSGRRSSGRCRTRADLSIQLFLKIPPAALKENQTHITRELPRPSARACCPPAPAVVLPCPLASTRLGLQSPGGEVCPAAAEASDHGAFVMQQLQGPRPRTCTSWQTRLEKRPLSFLREQRSLAVHLTSQWIRPPCGTERAARLWAPPQAAPRGVPTSRRSFLSLVQGPKSCWNWLEPGATGPLHRGSLCNRVLSSLGQLPRSHNSPALVPRPCSCPEHPEASSESPACTSPSRAPGCLRSRK